MTKAQALWKATKVTLTGVVLCIGLGGIWWIEEFLMDTLGLLAGASVVAVVFVGGITLLNARRFYKDSKRF